MRHVRLILNLALSITSSLVMASDFDSYRNFKALTDTPGMTFYHPGLFFAGEVEIKEIPELPYLNSKTNNDIQKSAWFLESIGVATAVGDNSGRDSQFDLYNPVSIDIGRNEPSVELSVPQKSREAEVGKWHFGTHDAWHLAYIPGPRLSDISTPEKIRASKDRLVHHLLLIESYATTLSGSRHARDYWNWRNKVNGAENTEEFERLNKGLYSISNMSESDFFDIIKAVMFGEVRNFSKTWNQNFDAKLYDESRKAGVPMLFPSFQKTLGDKGEKLFLKYGFGTVAGLANYLAPASGYGYQMFKAYARMQADYYLQPWYVKWADMYQVGLDFDAADARLAKIIQDLRNNQVMHDVKKPEAGVFEMMHTKNSSEQLGRRIIEFLELVKNNPSEFPRDLNQKLEGLLKLSHNLHNEILKEIKGHTRFSQEQVNYFRNAYSELTQMAEQQIPIEKSLPLKLRLPMADYKTYWNNAYGVILPRPSGMTKFLSARGIWESARKQRAARIRSELKGVPFVNVMPEGETIDDIEKRMGIIYDGRRSGRPVNVNSSSDASEYLNSIDRIKMTFAYQARQIFLGQIREYSELSTQEIKQVYEATESLVQSMDLALEQHKSNYKAVFVSRNASSQVKADFLRMEGNLKWATDQTLFMMADILDLSDFGKPVKAIKKYLSFANQMTTKLNSKTGFIIPNFKSYASYLFPKDTSRIKSLCSMLTRMCFNSNISDIVKSVSSDLKIAQVANLNLKDIPKNAALILIINHDSPIEDIRMAQLVAEKMGLKENNAILTSKRNWPQQKLFSNSDKSILFADDANLSAQVLEKLSSQRASPSVTIFPEGNTPGQHSQFPLSVKPGAFSLARKAAVALAEVKPVYLVTVTTNMLAHVTAHAELSVSVTQVTQVPTHPISSNDEWVSSQRLAFENAVSIMRGQSQVDLIHRSRTGSGTRFATKVKEYIPGTQAMETIGDSWKKTCREVVK